MRIDTGTSNNLNKSDFKKFNKLKEGDVIKAKIVEVSDGIAKIDLGNGEIVSAKLDVPLNLLKGKIVNFLIKDIKENMLFMSPVYEDLDFSNEFILKNKNLIMDRILNLNNLSKDDNNLNIIKSIIGYRMPLNPENIQAISSYTEKIISLLNLKEGEEIQAIAINDPLEEDINKLVKVESEVGSDLKDSSQSMTKNINTDITEKNDEFKSISIEFLNKQKIQQDNNVSNIIKDNEIASNQKNDIEFKDILQQFDSENSNRVEFKKITNQIQNEISDIFPPPIDTQDIIQKLTFLVKSNIDININNLSRLKELLENNQTLNKDLGEIVELALKEGVIDNKTKLEILDKTKNIDLKFDGKDDEKLSKFYKEISEVSEKILSQLSSIGKTSEELNTKVKNFNDNVEFFNKINENSTLMLIPFTLNNKQIENSLYVLSKRKVTKKSDNIKVYMVLNTNNLDSVKIFCDFSYDRLNVNFKVNEEHINLFNDSKQTLKNILESNGYENIFIYVNKEEKENVLDLISYDDTINYMLNIKV